MSPFPPILAQWFTFDGPDRALKVFGIRLVGISADTGKKLLFSLVLIVGLLLLNWLLHQLLKLLFRGRRWERVRFWTRQGVRLTVALVLILGMVSIWFNEPTRLATAAGLFTAGLAVALQRVITAWAGYFVILRGRTFNVGDRIVMGGVRGDVIALGFIQTTIMEMGQPPPVEPNADPAMWVRARQYTGRIVTVTNDKIFTEPVYNYTREFPYLWEELMVPVPYNADHRRAEQILLEAARKNTIKIDEISEPAILEMERRYAMKRTDMTPRVYWRLTDNWLELTVRFMVKEHGIRDIKDAMARDILAGFDEAHISVASGTYDIVGLPPIRIERPPGERDGDHGRHIDAPSAQRNWQR